MEKRLLFIPMYNCEKQIIRVLKQIDDNIQKYFTSIIIVNNRSTDNGEKAVIDYLKSNNFNISVKVLRNSDNYGLGGSHKVAFDYAIENNYDYVAVFHGDDQGQISDLIPVFDNKTYLNYDCMLGSRFMKGSKLKGYSKFRTFGNKVYNVIFSCILAKKISDLGSGINLYKVQMLKNKFYFKYPDKLTFNCYMLLAAKQYKHKINYFPITWKEDDQKSNVKMFSQAINTMGLLFSFFFKRDKYLKQELRDKVIDNYDYEIIFENMR